MLRSRRFWFLVAFAILEAFNVFPFEIYQPASAQEAYLLDTGDKVRILVPGVEALSNSYTVNAGSIYIPPIGNIPVRGASPQQLSDFISDWLKKQSIYDKKVSIELTYRPFFILGEVNNPGQFPFAANMTAETAVKIAGGFAPRAIKTKVELTRVTPGQQGRREVPISFYLHPGDTIVVPERP